MTDNPVAIKKVAFIGFGEVAVTWVNSWGAARPAHLTAYDIKTGEEIRARFSASGVEGMATPAEALAGADAVFSVVTADQALIAAEMAAKSIDDGTLWLDCNSCAPGTKKKAADARRQAAES